MLNAPPSNHNTSYSDREVKTILSLAGRLGLDLIAERFGRTPEAIQMVVSRHRTDRKRRNVRRVTKSETLRILHLLDKGRSYTEIADAVGRPRNTIASVLYRVRRQEKDKQMHDFSEKLDRAIQRITAAYNAELRNIDLTWSRFRILDAVERIGECNQVSIVRETAVDRSTVSSIVGALEDADLVKRQRTDTDTRSVMVSITKPGVGVLKKARDIIAKVDARIYGDIPEQTRQRALSAIERIAVEPALEAAE